MCQGSNIVSRLHQQIALCSRVPSKTAQTNHLSKSWIYIESKQEQLEWKEPKFAALISLSLSIIPRHFSDSWFSWQFATSVFMILDSETWQHHEIDIEGIIYWMRLVWQCAKVVFQCQHFLRKVSTLSLRLASRVPGSYCNWMHCWNCWSWCQCCWKMLINADAD